VYAQKVATILYKLNPSTKIRIVELPGLAVGEDVVEWIGKGGTADKLRDLIDQANYWKPEPKTGSNALPEEPPVDEVTLLARAKDLIVKGFDSLIKDDAFFRDLAKIKDSGTPAIIEGMVKDRKKQGFLLGHYKDRIKDAKAKLKAEKKANKSKKSKGESDKSGVDGERPEVFITTDESIVNDKVIEHLDTVKNLFVRGPFLMRIAHQAASKKETVSRKEGTPYIRGLTLPGLRELTTEVIQWMATKQDESGNEFEVSAHPPQWSINAIFDRGDWPGLRSIMGVVECPVLRPDGTILDKPGYDDATGLYYEPSQAFLPVKESPTLEDARQAVETIYYVMQDFPYVVIGDDGGATHFSAFLAALLTALARAAIFGPTPIFRFDAVLAGIGKTKQADIISITSTGRDMAKVQFPEKIEEQEKQIGAIALAGDSMVLLDNIKNGDVFGSPILDMCSTTTRIKVRILGKSIMPELDWNTILYATGNNLAAGGDGLRRIVPIGLATDDPNPETRTDFAIKGDILVYVREHRAELVQAALTILRAYAFAGRPKPEKALPKMDFVAWCEQVRDPVYWVTGYDPCATRAAMIADDSERNDLIALIEGFAEIPKSKIGMTALEILKEVDDFPACYEKLRSIMAEWPTKTGKITSKSLGKHLKAIKGRTIGQKKITATTYQGIQSWRVVTVESGGIGGSGGSASSHMGNDQKKNKMPREGK
jgi:hypothetical protein